ncbi:MAG: sugar-binding transcriptional regulator [bacterium]|jgi:lsr operon transcriptional repressor
MSRSLRSLHNDEEERFLVRVAWACYIEGLTQAAAAERFGVTRLRVNKALGDVRRRGLLRVSINSAHAPCAELETRLRGTYGIQEAHVAPTGDAETVQLRVGTALGNFLGRYLLNPEIQLFGMSWGNTLNYATRSMEPLGRPDLEIVTVMGGLSQGSDVNSFEITKSLAELCKAQHSYLTAPLYADSKRSRKTICELEVFREMISKIKSVDALAMAAGDLSSRALLIRYGLPKEVTVDELRRRGAVGDVLGYILDQDGQPIDHPINERIIGIELSDLMQVPNVILAAGGTHKVPIIRAALKAGLVRVLVTDEETAREMLSLDGGGSR